MRHIAIAAGIVFSSVSLFSALPAAAQIAMPAEEAPPPPPVTPDEVRGALQSLLADDTPAEEPISTADPEIALGALEIVLEPLTLDELRLEIDAWNGMLRDAADALSTAELTLFDMNAAEAAADEAAAEGGETAEPAPAADDDGMTPEKEALIEEIAELRGVYTGLSDRLKIAMDGFEAKGGDPGETAERRTYLAQVGGIEVDVTDAETAVLTVQQWALAEEGGQRILRNAATIIGATLAGFAIGWLIAVAVNIGLKSTDLSSRLLRYFLRRWIARVGGLIGLLFGLSSIGVNMTPILAGLGAAGFILAFALQNTISNFASGLLILLQRPFDAGDEVEAAGVTGEVERVSLFSTHLSTAENRKVIVPNNKIWDDVIVNSTGADTRRLAIEIEVNNEDQSLEETEEILRDVMLTHPHVLKEPAPEVKLSGMTAESHTFTCWPWVATADKDRVRWDLVTRFGRKLALVKGETKSSAA